MEPRHRSTHINAISAFTCVSFKKTKQRGREVTSKEDTHKVYAISSWTKITYDGLDYNVWMNRSRTSPYPQTTTRNPPIITSVDLLNLTRRQTDRQTSIQTVGHAPVKWLIVQSIAFVVAPSARSHRRPTKYGNRAINRTVLYPTILRSVQVWSSWNI